MQNPLRVGTRRCQRSIRCASPMRVATLRLQRLIVIIGSTCHHHDLISQLLAVEAAFVHLRSVDAVLGNLASVLYTKTHGSCSIRPVRLQLIVIIVSTWMAFTATLSMPTASCHSYVCPHALKAALRIWVFASTMAFTVTLSRPNASCHSYVCPHALTAALRIMVLASTIVGPDSSSAGKRSTNLQRRVHERISCARS